MALSDITSITEYKGEFKQGTTANLYLKIVQLSGQAVDPYNIVCTVSGPEEESSGSEVSSGIPFKADEGFYIYSWNIETDQNVGTYLIDWEYTVDEETLHEYQSIVVTDGEIAAPYFYTETWKAYRTALEHHIVCAQSIPVYYEQARPSYDKGTFKFTFSNWNTSAGARVYRNEQLVSSGIKIDYYNGKIIFDDALLPQDQVNVDYNFRWFSDDDLNRFLLNSLQTVNSYPPHSGYTLQSLPSRYTPAVLYGAAKDALRQLMMCLNFQQPAQVFGGTEEAQKAMSNFETLKQNYNSDWEKLLEQKKYGPYPSTRLISVPEYTLPGGRSRWFRYLFKS
jgi:hypothetical protein